MIRLPLLALALTLTGCAALGPSAPPCSTIECLSVQLREAEARARFEQHMHRGIDAYTRQSQQILRHGAGGCAPDFVTGGCL